MEFPSQTISHKSRRPKSFDFGLRVGATFFSGLDGVPPLPVADEGGAPSRKCPVFRLREQLENG